MYVIDRKNMRNWLCTDPNSFTHSKLWILLLHLLHHKYSCR